MCSSDSVKQVVWSVSLRDTLTIIYGTEIEVMDGEKGVKLLDCVGGMPPSLCVTLEM